MVAAFTKMKEIWKKEISILSCYNSFPKEDKNLSESLMFQGTQRNNTSDGPQQDSNQLSVFTLSDILKILGTCCSWAAEHFDFCQEKERGKTVRKSK